MNKLEFKEFVNNECLSRGFIKVRNKYRIIGDDVICEISLQKSNYGNVYYINYDFVLCRNMKEIKKSDKLEYDLGGRIVVMSKTQKYKGQLFMTALIEYEEYSEEELRMFLEKEFEEKILPPVYQGKKYILDNLNKIYFLALNRDEVMQKLKS